MYFRPNVVRALNAFKSNKSATKILLRGEAKNIIAG
jgi:hypothetical protein